MACERNGESGKSGGEQLFSGEHRWLYGQLIPLFHPLFDHSASHPSVRIASMTAAGASGKAPISLAKWPTSHGWSTRLPSDAASLSLDSAFSVGGASEAGVRIASHASMLSMDEDLPTVPEEHSIAAATGLHESLQSAGEGRGAEIEQGDAVGGTWPISGGGGPLASPSAHRWQAVAHRVIGRGGESHAFRSAALQLAPRLEWALPDDLPDAAAARRSRRARYPGRTGASERTLETVSEPLIP